MEALGWRGEERQDAQRPGKTLEQVNADFMSGIVVRKAEPQFSIYGFIFKQ